MKSQSIIKPCNASLVEAFKRFPATRYQGSKRKLACEIIRHLEPLSYETVLDAFGGTGAVSYAFKCTGKAVTYNDILAFNHQIGLALIENNREKLTANDIESIGQERYDTTYDRFIESTFEGIYFTDEENHWLDVAVANIRSMRGRLKRAIAWFGLFQAALAKRPYNLFHRRNLYMRTASVVRSFGNKTTWDRPFQEHFEQAVSSANAAIFEGCDPCKAISQDVMMISPNFDLVYIDTPYISRRGVGVKYRDFYHFLEGMVCYDHWSAMIDHRSAHRRLKALPDPWTLQAHVYEQFARLFKHFRNSILVVSYRSDGIPSITELCDLLRTTGRRVRMATLRNQQYALSKTKATREMLLIGTPR